MKTSIVMITLVATLCRATAGSIDQSFEPPGGGPLLSAYIYENYDGLFGIHAQTFTVGAFGYLDRVDVFIGRTFSSRPLLVDIRPTLGGAPLLENSSALASLTLAPSAVPVVAGTGAPPDPPGWVSLDFSGSPIPVVPGQQLALVLRTSLAIYGEYYWYGETNSPYSGGSAYARTGLVAERDSHLWYATSFQGGIDYGFRTFVTPVPEPEVLTLFTSSGILGLAFYAFRRKR